jgi:hypothetical protein
MKNHLFLPCKEQKHYFHKVPEGGQAIENTFPSCFPNVGKLETLLRRRKYSFNPMFPKLQNEKLFWNYQGRFCNNMNSM